MWVRTSGLSQPGQGLNFDSEGQSSERITSHLAGLLQMIKIPKASSLDGRKQLC